MGTERVKLDNNSFLSIDDKSFGLLSPKLHQVNALRKFRKAHKNEYRTLTPREKEILTLLARGNNNPKIAGILGISRRTVENHRKSINQKLQIKHIRDIIKYALAFGLILFKK